MPDEDHWQECRWPPLLALLFGWIKGANPSGRMWRRQINGKWEYKQDPETAADFDRRQY